MFQVVRHFGHSVTFVLVLAGLGYGNDMFVCKSISNAFSDSGTQYTSCKVFEEKIKALEIQIQQLQNIVSAEGTASSQKKYAGIAEDCSELFESGIREDGAYMISPDGKCPFKVYCDMANGGWSLIQKRVDGSVSFYRTWDEYVRGFGDISGNHWLGLDKVHRLTKDGAQIYFDIENYDGTQEHAHYKGFTVHDVTTAYRMNVETAGYDGTLKELLSYHDNQKFSTFDRDNDSSGSSCCKDLDGGGWWYKNCWHFNVNGIFGKKESGGIGYYDGRTKTVKFVNLKVKRRPGMC